MQPDISSISQAFSSQEPSAAASEAPSFPIESFAPGDATKPEAPADALSARSALEFCRKNRENKDTRIYPFEHVFCVSFVRLSQIRVCLEALAAEHELNPDQSRTDLLAAATENGVPQWRLWSETRAADVSSLVPRVAVVLQSTDASLLHKKTTFFRNSLELISRLIASFDIAASS